MTLSFVTLKIEFTLHYLTLFCGCLMSLLFVDMSACSSDKSKSCGTEVLPVNVAPTETVHVLWWHGVVFSGVRRMNEVNAHQAWLLPGWVTVFGRVYHLGM